MERPAARRSAPIPKKAAEWRLAARRYASQAELAKAVEAYRRALERDAGEPGLAEEAAQFVLAHDGEDRAALSAVVRALARSRRRLPEDVGLLLLQASALNRLGAFEEALLLLEEGQGKEPSRGELWLEAGIAHFERCRFDEAQRALEGAIARAAERGWAEHYLGLIAERGGQLAEAEKRLARARRLLGLPAPIRLGKDGFEKLAEAAAESLPPDLRRHLLRVPLRIEPLPSLADLMCTRPPLSPAILGLFKGPSLHERGGEREILLFQRNLERFCEGEAELLEQIALTLLHELGHLLGLGEEALWARGLE